MQIINVALIGQGFMGRTHSNAWGQVAKFFKPPLKPVMHTVFGQPEENPQLSPTTGAGSTPSPTGRPRSSSPEIGLVDVVTPNYMHAPVAKAAIAAGKPCSCEKPIAGTLAEAREMAAGRPGGRREDLRVVQLPPRAGRGPGPPAGQGGAVGTIRHVRAVYLQDWADDIGAAGLAVRKEAGRLRAPTATSTPTSST